jgi:hypothetical protein
MSAEIALGIVTIAAIIAGPILALEMQRRLDAQRDTRTRKLSVFKTLMGNRATPLSPFFVQALNLIDIEFDANNEKPVRDAWKVLLDHFEELGTFNQSGTVAPAHVLERTRSLTGALLLQMGKSLGYEFDEVQIKKGGYYPFGLGNVEQEQHAIRRGFLDLLEGKRRLPVGVFKDTFPEITLPPGTQPRGAAAPEQPRAIEPPPPVKKLLG